MFIRAESCRPVQGRTVKQTGWQADRCHLSGIQPDPELSLASVLQEQVAHTDTSYNIQVVRAMIKLNHTHHHHHCRCQNILHQRQRWTHMQNIRSCMQFNCMENKCTGWGAEESTEFHIHVRQLHVKCHWLLLRRSGYCHLTKPVPNLIPRQTNKASEQHEALISM